MEAKLRQQVFRAITNGFPINDDAYGKIIAAAGDITEEVRSGQAALPVYALLGFDPRAPESSSVLGHVESLVEAHWHSLRNSLTDRPVALLRCVIVIGLLDACDDSPRVASILYLSLRDTLERLAEPNESELRKDVLSYLKGLHEAAADKAWREELSFEPKPPVGKLQFALSETSTKTLVEQLGKAVAGDAVSALSTTETTEYELSPKWRSAFANGTATAVASAINALGSELATKLPRQLRNADNYHDTITKILNDATLAQRQGKLMWWLQAKYSTSLETSYRNLSSFEGAFHMARDLCALVPAPVPGEVEAVLKEAIITSYSAEAAKEEKVLQEVLEILASQSVPGGLGDPLQDREAGRLPFIDVIRLAQSNRDVRPSTEQWMGLPTDTRTTPIDMAIWLFRNIQAEALSR